MNLENIDWRLVIERAGFLILIWLFVLIIRRLLITGLKKFDARLDIIEFSKGDLKTITWIIDIVLLMLGLGITLSVLQIGSILLVSQIAPRLVGLTLTWVTVWVLVRYLSQWLQLLDARVEEINIDPRDLKTMDRILDVITITIGVIVSLAILNVTSLLYSALTAAGVFSVVIGFAVKDIASNMISGIFLLIDRPFLVGDAINMGGFSGTVNKISLRTTEITTFDGPIVTIPNSTMAVEATTNYTLSQHRRVLFTVSVMNTANLNLAINIIQDALDSENRLFKDKPPSILVNQIRDYAVELQVIAYTSKEDIFATQSDLQKELVDRFGEQGIELAVPVRMNLTSQVPIPR